MDLPSFYIVLKKLEMVHLFCSFLHSRGTKYIYKNEMYSIKGGFYYQIHMIDGSFVVNKAQLAVIGHYVQLNE